MPGTFEQTQGPTPVIDSIANKVLGDIYNYLRTQSGSEDTAEAIEELAAEQKKANQKQETRSKAAESNDRAVQNALKVISSNQSAVIKNENIASKNRAIQNALLGKINKYNGNAVKSMASDSRNRAVQNALLGNVNKGVKDTNKGLNKLKDGFKNLLSGLTDFLTPYLSGSLKSTSDLAKLMRKQNMSAADKLTAQLAASEALGNVKGKFNNLQISNDEASSFIQELIVSEKELGAMTKDQQASYIALRKTGVDEEKAYVAAMTATSQEIQGSINRLRDPRMAQAFRESFNSLNPAQIQAMGGYAKALNETAKNTASYVSKNGMGGVASGESKNIINAQGLIGAGAVDLLDDKMSDIAFMIGKTQEETNENLQKTNVGLLARVGAMDASWANLQMMKDAGANTGVNLYTDEQVGENNKRNTTNGLVSQTMDNIVATLNKSTGGMVGQVANVLDELLGDSADMGSLVKGGFKLVAGLLTALVVNTGPVGKFLFGGGILAAIFGVVKNRGAIMNMLSPLLGPLKDVLGSIDGLSPIVDSVSGIFDFNKEAADNEGEESGGFGGLANILSGLTGSIANATDNKSEDKSQSVISSVVNNVLSGLGSVLKEAIPIILDGLMAAIDFISNHMEGIIGFITDKVVPKLQEMIPKLAKILHQLFDALKPAISTLFKEAGPAIGGYLGLKFASIFGFGALKKLLWNLPKLIFDKIGNFAATIGTKLVAKLPALVSKLPAFLGKALTKFLPVILTKVLPFALKAIPVVGWIITGIQAVMWVIKTFFPDTYAKIMGFFDTVWQGIKGFFTETVPEFFTQTIPTFFTETIPTFFTETIPEKLGEFGNWLWEGITGFFGEIWDGLSAFFTETIPTFFTETIPEKLGEFGDWIWGNISDFFSGIWESLKEKLLAAKDFISKIPGEIGNFISKLPGELWEKIKVLPQEIANYLKDLIPSPGEALDAVGGAVSGALDAVGNLLPFGDGGPVNKPTKALLGESGKEVVVPLSSVTKASRAMSGLTDKERQIVSKATVGANTSQEYEKAVATLSKWTGGRMKPAEFFALFGPIAREDMRTTGIPASVTLAQAALESGWGKTAKAEFKNLFGIKGKGNAGSAVVNTHEVYDGVRVQKKDAFAQYLTYLDSITAHSDYLLNAKRKKGLEGLRYGEALTHIFEPNLFAYLLREGGYATSTAYGKKLVNVMKSHNLYKWDVSNLSLKNVGSTQSKLMAKAKENLVNAAASNERMNQLLREEHTREVERAIKEGKIPPEAMASFAANGGSLSSAMIGQSTDQSSNADNSAAMMASMTDAVNTAEATYNELEKLPKDTPLEQLRNLSNIALESVKQSASGESWFRTNEASDKISKSLDSKEVLACLSEIVRYLRSIVSSKKPAMAVARPVNKPV